MGCGSLSHMSSSFTVCGTTSFLSANLIYLSRICCWVSCCIAIWNALMTEIAPLNLPKLLVLPDSTNTSRLPTLPHQNSQYNSLVGWKTDNFSENLRLFNWEQIPVIQLAHSFSFRQDSHKTYIALFSEKRSSPKYHYTNFESNWDLRSVTRLLPHFPVVEISSAENPCKILVWSMKNGTNTTSSNDRSIREVCRIGGTIDERIIDCPPLAPENQVSATHGNEFCALMFLSTGYYTI